MKHLEILIVGREAADGLGDDDQVITAAAGPDEAVRLLREQGLGFDAVVLEPGVELALLDELRAHPATANTPVVRVREAGRGPGDYQGYDATLAPGYGRRELRDAVHYAMGRRGLL